MVLQRIILKLRTTNSNFLLLLTCSGFFFNFKEYPQQSVDIFNPYLYLRSADCNCLQTTIDIQVHIRPTVFVSINDRLLTLSQIMTCNYRYTANYVINTLNLCLLVISRVCKQDRAQIVHVDCINAQACYTSLIRGCTQLGIKQTMMYKTSCVA